MSGKRSSDGLNLFDGRRCGIRVCKTNVRHAAAVIAAGRRPDKVAGLVLIAPFLRNGASEPARRILSIALARPWGPFVWRAYACY